VAADVPAPTIPEMRVPSKAAEEDTTDSAESSDVDADVTVTEGPETTVFPLTLMAPEVAVVRVPPTAKGPVTVRVLPTVTPPVITEPFDAARVPVTVVAVVLTWRRHVARTWEKPSVSCKTGY
jgi:hypothetical protein